jgi:hypothetical protein
LITRRSPDGRPPRYSTRCKSGDAGSSPLAARVLFFVEGFTDFRFVIGLSEICDLMMVVLERQYVESGLKGRIESAGGRIEVVGWQPSADYQPYQGSS